MEQPIKVLYIIGSFEFGGTETHLLQLFEKLDRNKVKPYVCVLYHEGQRANKVKAQNVPIWYASFYGKLSFLKTLRQFRVVIKLCRQEKIDIIHAFLYRSDLYGMALKLFKAGKYLIIAKRNEDKHMRLRYLFVRMANRAADQITANSKRLAQWIVDHEKVSSKKITVIYNGVDSKKFSPPNSSDKRKLQKKYHLPIDDIIIGTIGSFHNNKKNYPLLVHTASDLLKSKTNFHFACVGDGILRDSIESLTKTLDIDNHFTFTGYLKNPAEILKTFDIFILLSKKEGMSNALLEASATGLPCVVMDVGGNREIVENTRGIIVNGSQNISEQILKMIEMEPKSNSKIKNFFSINRMIDNYYQLYYSIN